MPAPLRRVADFLRTESAGGGALVAATVLAIVWANVGGDSYREFWSTSVSLPGPAHALTLGSWVNEGLMAIFFFVVGLEIKREIVDGELRAPRTAAVPVVAAIGGMVIPALIYTAINAGTPTGHGWGVPMATDIAFAIGVLRLAGPRLPRGIGLTLVTLAIVDDLGAIAVIAIFYSAGISLGWLAVAFAGVVLVVLLRRVADHPLWYLIPAVVIWVALQRSGVHPTVAGVLVGFLTPLRTKSDIPILSILEDRLHPWSSLVVVPVFALANAGIVVSVARWHALTTSRLALGVVLGLTVGKVVGIVGGTWIATRFGAELPSGVTRRAVFAIGLLGGIGFTVSLFVAGLAFDGSELGTAKLAILVASVAAALLGTLCLRTIPSPADSAT